MELKYGKPEAAGMSSSRIAKLENIQKEWVEKGVSPIIVSLIARKGIIVSHKIFVDPDYNREYGSVDIDSIFQLASITKPVTATAAMLLAEEGKISLQWPVQDYIPEFTGQDKEKVHLHHLLTHTSGIDVEKIDDIKNSKDFVFDVAECPKGLEPEYYKYLKASLLAPLKTLPGTEMEYCGLGFEIMAEIIRRATGKTIDEFAYEHIFKPLGMTNSFYKLPEELFGRIAKHPRNAPFPDFSDYNRLNRMNASGSLCSTAMDMAIFCQMLLNGGIYNGKRILSKLSVDKMTMNQIPGVPARYGVEVFKEAGWGFGWNISGDKHDYTGTLRSEKTYSHSGRGNTLIMVDPVNELITINFQITMKRIDNRPYHYFGHFNDMALSSIEE